MLEHRTNQEVAVRNQEQDIALAANSRYPKDQERKAGSSMMWCSVCNSNSHNQASCRNRSKNNENRFDYQQPSKKIRVKCTYCNYNNHVREECRTRQRHEREAQAQREKEKKGSLAQLGINQQDETETFDIEHAFAAFNLGKLNLNDWFADSGSTEHMTEHHHYFTSLEPVSHKWNVRGVGKDHKSLGVKGRGDIKIQVTISDDVHYGVLRDVFYVPGIGVNLFSIGKATDRGITAIFEKQCVKMYRVTTLN